MLSNIEIMVSSFQFWRFASTHLMRMVFQECQLRRILSQHLGAACENPVDSGKMPSVYALGFEVLIHKVGPLLIFDDGPRVRNRVDRTDRTPEGALAQICPFRVVSSCHLQAFVWNDRWNARIWPWTISFDAGRTGSITGDVAWWIASIRLLPQQNDWTLDSFDRIRILLWQLFARAARYSQTSKHPLECFAFNPHDYCDEILGTIWTSNLTVHSCWVLQLHWYSTPE